MTRIKILLALEKIIELLGGDPTGGVDPDPLVVVNDTNEVTGTFRRLYAATDIKIDTIALDDSVTGSLDGAEIPAKTVLPLPFTSIKLVSGIAILSGEVSESEEE